MKYGRRQLARRSWGRAILLNCLQGISIRRWKKKHPTHGYHESFPANTNLWNATQSAAWECVPQRTKRSQILTPHKSIYFNLDMDVWGGALKRVCIYSVGFYIMLKVRNVLCSDADRISETIVRLLWHYEEMQKRYFVNRKRSFRKLGTQMWNQSCTALSTFRT